MTGAFAAGLILDLPHCLWLVPVLCLTRRRCRFSAGWLLPVSLAVLAAAWQPRGDSPEVPSSTRLLVHGWVASRPERNTSSGMDRGFLRVEQVRLLDANRLVDFPRSSHLLLRSSKALPAYGSRLQVQGNYEAPRARRNFYGMQEIDFLQARDAWGTLYAQDFQHLAGARGPGWRRQLIEPWREHLFQQTEKTLNGMPRGLLLALVLGIRSDLEIALRDAWRALGMSHVLALSGMHIGVVAAGLLSVVGNVRRPLGLFGLLGGVFTYAAVGGLGSSVLRASLMIACASIATFLGRARNPLRTLGTAAFLLVAAAPARLHDLGFQLSCAATLGILVTAGPTARWALRQRTRSWPLRLLAWVLPVGGIGLSAQIVTLPWILTHFGYVSWISPLANLLLVPIVDVALVLGLSGAAFSVFRPAMARCLWMVSGALLQFVGWISVQLVAWCDPRVFLRNHPPVIVMAACAAVAFVLGMLLRGRRRLILLLLCCLCIIGTFVLGSRVTRAAWQIDMLDIGQGDAFVLRLGTDNWLIDAGPQRPVDQGERTIVPYLQREGIDHLRGILVSHPHLDHFGGVGAVLAQVKVDSLYVATPSWDHPVYKAWRQQYAAVPHRGLASGDRIAMGETSEALVLWPPREDVLQSGANGVSVSLWLRSRAGPALLCMGDLEEDGEEALLATWGDSLRAAAGDFLILKAAHHGSDTSSSPAFLDAIDAEIALVSTGKRNRYGHPSPLTLQALRERHCVTLRTDEGGDIRLQQRGMTLWLRRPAGRLQMLTVP